MEHLPLPTHLKKTAGKGAHGVFTIEPLYPGYGTTIGNSLRRVMLSSMPGAAITHVKFEGAEHEFSTLPFVKEDVVDIILNLKQVRLRVHSDEPVTIELHASGDGVVTAGDITPNGEVDIISKDQTIATLTDKAAKLSMTFIVARGRGYVPVESREKEKTEIGMIAIDAIYTPLKNVNFTTESVRVGQMTNYDRLILDITTDGTMKPEEALNQASQIMVEHFQFILAGPTADIEAPAVAEETPAAEEVASDEAPAEPKAKKAKKKASEE